MRIFMKKLSALLPALKAMTLGLLMLLAANTFALDLKSAKAGGQLGEMHTGYVGVMVDSPEAKQIAESINAKRKAHYEKIAAKNGTSLEAVEQLAGQKAIQKTPAGQYIDAGSGWTKK